MVKRITVKSHNTHTLCITTFKLKFEAIFNKVKEISRITQRIIVNNVVQVSDDSLYDIG